MIRRHNAAPVWALKRDLLSRVRQNPSEQHLMSSNASLITLAIFNHVTTVRPRQSRPALSYDFPGPRRGTTFEALLLEQTNSGPEVCS